MSPTPSTDRSLNWRVVRLNVRCWVLRAGHPDTREFRPESPLFHTERAAENWLANWRANP